MEQTKIKYKSFYGDPKTFFCQSLKFDIISCGKETLGKRNNQKKIEVVKDETVITKLVHQMHEPSILKNGCRLDLQGWLFHQNFFL